MASFPIGAALARVGHEVNDAPFAVTVEQLLPPPGYLDVHDSQRSRGTDDRLLVRHVFMCGGPPQKRLCDDVKRVVRAMIRINVEDRPGMIQDCTLTDIRGVDAGRLELSSTPGCGAR